jgi:diguanylate cyclase (GGDEF)-like protein
MEVMQRASRITVVAGGLLVATAWVAGTFGPMGRYQNIIDIAAEATSVLLFILAWRYRRDRLAVITLVIAAANFLIRTGRVPITGGITLTALSVVVAADFAIIAIIRDRPVWRPMGIAWMVVLAAQLWFVVAGVDLAGDGLAVGFTKPGVIEGAFAAAGIVVIIAFFLRRGAFEGSLIWALMACAAALIGGRGPNSATLLFAAAQLALLVGLFEDSYRLAFHDELTGLPGRRALDEVLGSLGGTFTIAMVDIDHFKRFNDRHGHDAGDQVLRMVSDRLARVVGGRAYRYGGEEFTIVFPARNAADVRDDLDALRASIADREFTLRAPDRPKTRPDKPKKKASSAKRVTVTVSIGAAGSNSRRRSTASVLKAADKALYRAKRAGRNRLVAAGDRLPKRN